MKSVILKQGDVIEFVKSVDPYDSNYTATALFDDIELKVNSLIVINNTLWKTGRNIRKIKDGRYEIDTYLHKAFMVQDDNYFGLNIDLD